MIIGFSGLKGSGKDTCADYIVKKYNYNKIAFAGPLKEICGITFGFDNDQLYGNKKEVKDPFWGIRPRDAFQYIGTDMFRNRMQHLIPGIGEEIWVKVAEKQCINHLNEGRNVVISDVRFQNELDMIQKHGGVVIYIDRPKCKKNGDNHTSETEMLSISNYNEIIVNDKTIDVLYENIEDVFKKYN